jgi:[NiFe] hydrogenase assembly HybE family chaperone
MSDAAAFAPDPSAALEARYREVGETRMRGLPFVNAALAVEAVGFAPFEGRWLGVMVTPWFINLVLAPLDPAAWRSIGPGDKLRYRFPAGEYEFIGANEPGVGEFQACSLFSPVLEFVDQPTARFVAEHARAALLDAANREQHDAEEARAGPIARVEQALDAPVSRRDVLRGRFSGDADVDRR